MPKPTILLIEDHEDDISLLRNAFNRADPTHVQVVENGNRALDYLAGNGKYQDRETFPLPILVLLDLKMPGRTGFEVVQWVRSNRALKCMPIVVLTDCINVDDINRAYDMGINSYLVKPIDFEELAAVVKTFVEYWLMFSKHPTYPLLLNVC